MTELSEKEKLEILNLVRIHGKQWKFISTFLPGRTENTIKSFYTRFLKSGTISPKRGRPKQISEEVKNDLVDSVKENPEQTLSQMASDSGISRTSAKTILNDNHISYHNKIAITPLKPWHIEARLAFANRFLVHNYKDLWPMIFTDESTVVVNLNSGGIWRARGHYPPQAFFEKDKKPPSIMVWGGIGPRGFRTKLIKFTEHVNATTYQKSLEDNKIFESISNVFGEKWVWQQDGATPHTAEDTLLFILPKIPHLLPWPAFSPDLSPIEQVWSYIKKKLAGQKFEDPDELFNAIEQTWNEIPDSVLHNIYSSFYARLVVCKEIGGVSLNGHWTRVKAVHDQYRTELSYFNDPETGQLMVTEV